MAFYEEIYLWKGQHELMDKIHDFLETTSLEETQRLSYMLILSCKADDTDQMGYGISTAIRHALYSYPHDIWWRCSSEQEATNVLQTLVPKNTYCVIKYNQQQLWYNLPDQSIDRLYKRISTPISQKNVRSCCPELIVYDDVTLNNFSKVLEDTVSFSFSPKKRCIVVLTIPSSKLTYVRELTQIKHVFHSICDVTHWYKDVPGWKSSFFRWIEGGNPIR